MSHHRYAAVVSYDSGRDGQLAQQLQRALHGFARRWHTIRALRVFVDRARPFLRPVRPSMAKALGSSDHLVLLASPEAAASPRVQREVAHWLAGRGLHADHDVPARIALRGAAAGAGHRGPARRAGRRAGRPVLGRHRSPPTELVERDAAYRATALITACAAILMLLMSAGATLTATMAAMDRPIAATSR